MNQHSKSSCQFQFNCAFFSSSCHLPNPIQTNTQTHTQTQTQTLMLHCNCLLPYLPTRMRATLAFLLPLWLPDIFRRQNGTFVQYTPSFTRCATWHSVCLSLSLSPPILSSTSLSLSLSLSLFSSLLFSSTSNVFRRLFLSFFLFFLFFFLLNQFPICYHLGPFHLDFPLGVSYTRP